MHHLQNSIFSISIFGLCFSSYVDAATISGNVQRKASGVSSGVAATITCYDEDGFDADDQLVTGYSSSGAFSFGYTKKTNVWYGPCRGWDCSGAGDNPDIYCYVDRRSSVYPSIYPYRTGIIQEWNQDKDTNWGTITVYPDRRQTWCANTCGPAAIDMLPDFEFTEECKQHDCCYEDCSETQSNCDIEFYELMLSRCREVYSDSILIEQCYDRAYINYYKVATWGAGNFGCRHRELDENKGGDEGGEQDALVYKRLPEDDGYITSVDKRSAIITIAVFVGIVSLFVTVIATLCICHSYRKVAQAAMMEKDTETNANEEM